MLPLLCGGRVGLVDSFIFDYLAQILSVFHLYISVESTTWVEIGCLRLKGKAAVPAWFVMLERGIS